MTNTHRRQMRPVTPATRASRGIAGAAIAATFVMTGSGAALADGAGTDSSADVQADAPAAAVIAPAVAAPVDIPAAKAEVDTAFGAVLIAEPTALKATAPVVEEEPEQEAPETEQNEAEQATNAEANEEATERSTESAESTEQDSNDDSSSNGSRGESKKSRSEQRSNREQRRNNEQREQRQNREERQEREERSEQPRKKKEKAEKKEESSGSAGQVVGGGSIVATARNGIGVPYVSGGTSPAGWDCSGFVQWVYAQHGISLPRTDSAQAAYATRIPASEARPGDLIRKPGHIGIYAGNGRMIDAGNSRVDTLERNIYSGNWSYYRVTR